METEFYKASLLSNCEMRYGVVDELLLSHCDKSQYLGSEQKLLFGQWEMRIFFEYFEKDDILLDSYKIPYIRKIYHGKHEWKIWSQFFFEFVQIIFKEK